MLEIEKAKELNIEETMDDSFTIEELMEIDEYLEEGKLHPLLAKQMTREQLRKWVGRYGRQAEEYLQSNNYSKWLKLNDSLILEKELIKIDEKVEKFMDDMWDNYPQPKTDSFIEAYNHRLQYEQMVQERIFEEIIKPFALDD